MLPVPGEGQRPAPAIRAAARSSSPRPAAFGVEEVAPEMKVIVTGGSGFVGSNIAHVLGRHDAEVLAPGHAELELTDAGAVARYVQATRPDGIVHTAIWNDPAGLVNERRRAWRAYVGATRAVVDAANAAGAHVVLVSTDWVFDGTQGPAAEDEPPNPTSPYGVLKGVSESVVRERGARGTTRRS